MNPSIDLKTFFMTELMASGVELMLVGMGIVYLFLAMLIVAIMVMARLVSRFLPDLSVVTETPMPQTVDQGSIAAITAAIHQYKIKHK